MIITNMQSKYRLQNVVKLCNAEYYGTPPQVDCLGLQVYTSRQFPTLFEKYSKIP